MVKARHTGLIVDSIDRVLKFYRDMLGLVVIDDRVEEGKFIETVIGFKYPPETEDKPFQVRTVKLGSNGHVFLELLKYLTVHPIIFDTRFLIRMGFAHVAFTVRDIDDLWYKLGDAGVPFLSRPQVSPDGKAKVCFCRDPEGNYVELVEEL